MITVQTTDPDVWCIEPGFYSRTGTVERHGPASPTDLTALPCGRCLMRTRCGGECQAFADYVKHGAAPRQQWPKKRRLQSGASIGGQQS